MSYSYKNWNEDKSCFLGENLIIAVRSIQHCSDIDPLFCDWCALRSSCCPPPRSGSTRLNIGHFQYLKSSLKTMTVEVVQTDVHLKQGNKLDCLILEEARWDFFTLRVMIILSLFTHHKVKGSFNNLFQNKAFLGCWGWIGSTKMLCKSAGEAVRCSSSEVCWPLWPHALRRN